MNAEYGGGALTSVVFVSHDVDARQGAEKCLLDLVGALRSGSSPPAVAVVVTADGEMASRLRDMGARTEVVPRCWWAARTWPSGVLRRTRIRARALWLTVRNSISIARLARNQHAQLIVTSTAVVPAGALAAFFCRLPHVWWVHEYVDRDHDFTFVFGRHLSTRLIGLASTEVVFNSRAVATHFSAVPDRKKSVMYYGIEVQPGVRVVPPSSGEDLELLLLGRRSRTKGGEEALRAVALLVERGVRVRLRMVGAPSRSFDERLEQLRRDLGLEQAVEFIDHSTRPVVEIDRAHILLMCSRNEAFGRVTVEALKRGRPVIGTNTGGTAELIDHGVNGSLYPPGDIEALAASIERFARDPALLVACSDAALASNDRFKVEDERAQFLELAVRAIS